MTETRRAPFWYSNLTIKGQAPSHLWDLAPGTPCQTTGTTYVTVNTVAVFTNPLGVVTLM